LEEAVEDRSSLIFSETTRYGWSVITDEESRFTLMR
jgi:hypothetical protein